MGAGSSSNTRPLSSKERHRQRGLAALALHTHEKWSERAAVPPQTDAEARHWATKHCRRPDCALCRAHRARPGALAPTPYLGRPTPEKSATLRREKRDRLARARAVREAAERVCPVDTVTIRWVDSQVPDRPPVPQLLLEHQQEEHERCSREGSVQERAPSPVPSWMRDSPEPSPLPLRLPPLDPALLEPTLDSNGVLPRKAIMKNASKAWKNSYAVDQHALESFMRAREPTPLQTLACARDLDFGAHGHMFAVTARGGEDVVLLALRTGPQAAPPVVRGIVVSQPCVLYAAPGAWQSVSRIRDPWREVGRTIFTRQADLSHRIVLEEPLRVAAGETVALYLHTAQRYGLGFSLAGDGLQAPLAGQDQFLEAAVGVAVHCAEPWDWVNRGILPDRDKRAPKEEEAEEAAPAPTAQPSRAGGQPPKKKPPTVNISALDVSFAGVLEYELPRCAAEHALAQELRADPEGKGEAVAAALAPDGVTPLYERVQEPYHEFANRYWELFCRRRHQLAAWRYIQETDAMLTHSDDDSHHSSDFSASDDDDDDDRRGEV